MDLEDAPERHHLLNLPGEIRLHLYRTMFGVDRAIPFSIREDGYIEPHHPHIGIKLSLQFLRTCRKIYLEAAPVLYGYNTFSISASDVYRFPSFKQSSRMCIEKVRINHHDEKLELGPLGDGLPFVQEVDIACCRPLGFLIITSALSKSLPCSSIRQWPRLEVHVTSDQTQIPVVTSTESADRIRTALAQTPFKLSALGPISTVKGLGLGHEMPSFGTIRIHGALARDFVRGIARHKCSFGDCGFYKHEDDKPCEMYVWRKEGTLEDAAALQDTGSSKDATSAMMTQWVPRLSEDWYKKVLEAGLQPSHTPGKESVKD